MVGREGKRGETVTIKGWIDEIYRGDEVIDGIYIARRPAGYGPIDDLAFIFYPGVADIPDTVSVRINYCNEKGEHVAATIPASAIRECFRGFRRLYPGQALSIELEKDSPEGDVSMEPEEDDDRRFMDYLNELEEQNPPRIPGAAEEEQFMADVEFFRRRLKDLGKGA